MLEERERGGEKTSGRGGCPFFLCAFLGEGRGRNACKKRPQKGDLLGGGCVVRAPALRQGGERIGQMGGLGVARAWELKEFTTDESALERARARVVCRVLSA